MANDASRASILDGLIRDAGVPIDGISVVSITTTPVTVNVQYQPSATAEQRALGDQIVAQFDWRRRRKLARDTVVTALQNLTQTQRNTLLLHLLSEYMRNNVQAAAQIGTATGIPLTVDEVDPN